MPAYSKCEGVNLKDKVKVSIDQFMLNKKEDEKIIIRDNIFDADLLLCEYTQQAS